MVKRLTTLLISIIMLLTFPGVTAFAIDQTSAELEQISELSMENKSEQATKLPLEGAGEQASELSHDAKLSLTEKMNQFKQSLNGITLEEFFTKQLTTEKGNQLKVNSATMEKESTPFWLEASWTKDTDVIVTMFGDKSFLERVNEVDLFISLPNSKEAAFDGQLSAKQTCVQIENVTPDTKYLVTATIHNGDDVISYIGQFTVTKKDSYVCTYSFTKESYKSKDTVKQIVKALEMRSIVERSRGIKMVAPLADAIRYEVEPNDTLGQAYQLYDDDTMYGKIEYRGDMDMYKIMFNEAGNANFWLGDIPDGKNYDLFLYNSDGNSVAESATSNNQEQIYDFPVAGGVWYYLGVSAGYENYDTDNYYRVRAKNYPIPADDYGNSFSTAENINENTSTMGRINSGGDIDYFKFYATRTGTYSFCSTESGTNVDTYGCLYDSNYNLLEENDDAGFGSNFYINRRLQGGQWYYFAIRAFSSSNTGYYRFDLNYLNDDYDDYGNSIDSASQANVGEVLGKIEHSGDEDYFKFRPTDSGLYDIYTDGSLDTYGYLYDSQGYLVTQDDDGGSGSNFKISRELSANEWYYIRVKAYSSSATGPYTLAIGRINDDDHADSLSGATMVDIGSTYGTLENQNDVDCFAFTPPTTGSYKIYTTGSTNTCGYLWDSDQSRELSASYRTPIDENLCLARTLEVGKTYYISICPETSSGAYTLWVSKLAEPTEPEFQNQWAILNRGYFVGDFAGVDSTIGKDINVLPVWEYTKGAGVKIGILDTGVATDHEDLRDNIDNNLAYNFIYCNQNLLPPLDQGIPNNHGTNVAGIAAAEENGKGIVGVAPESTIIPMALVMDMDGITHPTFKEAWINSIYYAVEHNIGILNMSFGGMVDNIYAVELRRTIEAADNVLFVVAAGNDGSDISNTSSLPAFLNTWNMITVANSDRYGALYATSNYGSIVHIAAPGNLIFSSYGINEYGNRADFYGPTSGTSMAAPHVSGVAALIKSYYPDISVSELKERIIKQQNASYDWQNFDGKVTSSGILNAWYAFCDDSNFVRKSLSTKSLSRPVASNATTREKYTGELASNTKELIQETLMRQIKVSEQAANCDLDCITLAALETKEEITLTNRIYVNIDSSADKDALIALIAPNARKLRDMSLTGSVQLEFDSITEAVQAVVAFNAHDAVLYAEPVYNTPIPELY